MAVCPAHLGEKYDRQMYEKEYCLPIDHEKERKFIVGESYGGDLSQRILPLTCRQAIELLPLTFKRENAKNIDAIIQYNIRGEETGNWYAIVKNQTCRVKKGFADSPTLTIDAPSHIWLKISRREKNATMAYILRQFKAKGDKRLLRRLTSIF